MADPLPAPYRREAFNRSSKGFRIGAYVFIPAEIRTNKLAPKSELMTYLGNAPGAKGVRGLLQPLLGCASHDQRYPSGRIDNYQAVFLISPGAPVKGLKIGVYGRCLVVVSGPLGVARQDTR